MRTFNPSQTVQATSRISRMIAIQNVDKFVELLWPRFITVADSVFLECECHGDTVTLEHVHGLAGSEVGLQSNEWFINHVHIFDLIGHEAPIRESPDGSEDFDFTHPDFQAAWQLSKQFVRAWSGKLALDFPGECFVVVATKISDPIIRFYRQRPLDMFSDVRAHFAEMTQRDEAFIQFSQ